VAFEKRAHSKTIDAKAFRASRRFADLTGGRRHLSANPEPALPGTDPRLPGLGVAEGSLWAIGLVVPLLWVINVGVVRREERYLERKFGDAYRAYKARVRRWI
jgi:hypothetical protein